MGIRQSPVSNISIFFGHVASNVGDLAINKGQMALFRESFPDAAINIVLFGNKSGKYVSDALLSLGGVFSNIHVFIPSESKMKDYLLNPTIFLDHCCAQNADLIVIASGEYLFSYIENKNMKALFWRTLPILAAKIAGKQSVLLPSTFGPFEKVGSNFIKTIFDLVDNFSFRDSSSAKYFSELTSTDSVPLLDPAFFINGNVDEMSLGENEYVAPDGHLAISMRSEGWGIRLSPQEKNEKTSLFKADKYISSRAYQFTKHLCHNYLMQNSGAIIIYIQTIADRELAEFVFSAIVEDGGSAERIKIYSPTSIDNYLKNLSLARYVVASRFHAIILALVVQRPVCGVYFDAHGHKMPGLFELIKAPEKCFNLSDLSPDNVADEILNALLKPQEWLNTSLSHINQLREKTIDWVKSLVPRENGPQPQLNILNIYKSYLEMFNPVKSGYKYMGRINKKEGLEIKDFSMHGYNTRKESGKPFSCSICDFINPGKIEKGICVECQSRARIRTLPLMFSDIIPSLVDLELANSLPVLAFSPSKIERKMLLKSFNNIQTVSLYGSYGENTLTGVDARDLSRFKDNTFSGVHSMSVYEYFLEQEQALREAYRVIARGGVFMCLLAPTRVKTGDGEPTIIREFYPSEKELPYVPKHIKMVVVSIQKKWYIKTMEQIGFDSQLIEIYDEIGDIINTWFVGKK